MNGDIALRAAASVAEARATAAHLCLDQALGGDSAYTLFACADLGEVLHHLGDRGYRVAKTEVGIAVGRMQLAAFALGYVGEPSYTPVPGGRPGHPTELTHR